MALMEEFDRQGSFLFRWRSYVPSVIIVISAFFVPGYRYAGGNYSSHLYYSIPALIVSLLGLFVRCYTIGYAPEKTSGRNTKKQVAETVNQSGIYSMVRHPLYLGNFLMFFGIVIFVKSIAFSLIFILFYWMYYERIMYTEEHFLRTKFGAKYLNWADTTPAILPAFSKFKKADLVFSFRNILKREYPSLTGIAVMFLIYDILFIYFNEPGRLTVGLPIYKEHHIYAFAATLAFYIIARIIVKFTKWLEVEGR